MRKHVLIGGLLLCLSYNLSYAQLSLGVRAGGTFLTPSHFFSATEITRGIESFNQERPSRITNDQALLNDLSNIAMGNTIPFYLEFGGYLSAPITKTIRLRLALSLHDLNMVEGESDLPAMFAQTGTEVVNIRYSALFNEFTGPRFVKPSIHFHLYPGPSVALNIGASYSLKNSNYSLRRILYGRFSLPSSNGEDSDLFELVDVLEQPAIFGDKGFWGLNLGFLFKLWHLPKIEIQAAIYFPQWKNEFSIHKEVRFPGLPEPLLYSVNYSVTDRPVFASLTLFLEL